MKEVGIFFLKKMSETYHLSLKSLEVTDFQEHPHKDHVCKNCFLVVGLWPCLMNICQYLDLLVFIPGVHVKPLFSSEVYCIECEI
jgi:hypothetical protein